MRSKIANHNGDSGHQGLQLYPPHLNSTLVHGAQVLYWLRSCTDEHWTDTEFAAVKVHVHVDPNNAFKMVSHQAPRLRLTTIVLGLLGTSTVMGSSAV